jgi:MscS family membrane protein
MAKGQYLLWCLDLRNQPPSIAMTRGFQSSIALKEVLDRVDYRLEDVPDETEVARDKLTHWRLPGTEIALTRIDSGPHEGEWVFDRATVERAEEYFDRARNLPYKAGATTPGLHDVYVHLTGWMVPEEWIESLPAWLKAEYLDHRLWQLLAIPLLIGLATALVVWTRRLGRGATPAGSEARLAAGAARFVSPLLWMGFAVFLDDFFTTQIRLTGMPLLGTKMFLQSQVFVGASFLVLTAMNWLAEVIIQAKRMRSTGLDGQLVRLGMRVLVSLAVAWLLVAAAETLGISVMPLLAGLGVSGLAVALAAQYTVENLIAGLVIYADKTVKVGETCQFGDIIGTVEQIGLRSTRIRGIDRRLVTVPNAEFAKMKLINSTRRDRVLLKTVLGLRFETTPDQLRYVLARIREMLLAHPRVNPDPARARFVGFGAHSLDVEVFAYVDTTDYNEFLGIQEDVLLRIADIVAGAGTGFAFPSQTTYLAKDDGLDPERARAAGTSVDAWRRSGVLPFPEFPAETRASLSGSLAFPGPGAPGGPPWEGDTQGPRVDSSHGPHGPHAPRPAEVYVDWTRHN